MSVIVGNTGANQDNITANGQPLARVYVGDRLVWQKLSKKPSIPAYSDIKFGMLYNKAVICDPRILLPEGWSIPSENDWNILSAFVSGGNLPPFYGGDTNLSGDRLRESGTDFWIQEYGAINDFGFNGRGAGYRDELTGAYTHFKIICCFFTSDFNQTRNLLFATDWLSYSNLVDNKGYSIRAIFTGNGVPNYFLGNDGKRYRIKKIGEQYWLVDNLAETKFRDGSLIPIITDNNAWINATGAGACYPNGNPLLV